MRTPLHLRKPGYVRGPQYAYPTPNTNPTRRVGFRDDGVMIWAWPSPGGLIVLERATALDFEFLGLDRVNLQMSRDSDQDAEDEFSKRLLLLGARWFDSEDRYQFVAAVAEDDDGALCKLDAKKEPLPTEFERRWVSVALKNGVNADDGLWVLEFETQMRGFQEKHNLVPWEARKVDLAKNMNEKCKILEAMGAKFYNALEDYDGMACLNMWG